MNTGNHQFRAAVAGGDHPTAGYQEKNEKKNRKRTVVLVNDNIVKGREEKPKINNKEEVFVENNTIILHESSAVIIKRKPLASIEGISVSKNEIGNRKDDGRNTTPHESFITIKSPASTSLIPRLTERQSSLSTDDLVNSSGVGSSASLTYSSSTNTNNGNETVIARLNNEYNILTRHFCTGENVPSLSYQNGNKIKGKAPSSFPDKRVNDKYRHHHIHAHNHKSKYTSVRAALSRTINSQNGKLQSLNLEYVPGISLFQWIESNPYTTQDEPSRSELLDRLCIAVSLVGALADVHETGVIHNDVVPSSFIVDTPGDEEESGIEDLGVFGHESSGSDFYKGRDWTSSGNNNNNSCNTRKRRYNCNDQEVLHPWPVKIISFGYAEYGNSIEADDSGRRVNDDLPALGSVLKSLFLGDMKTKKGCNSKNDKIVQDDDDKFSDEILGLRFATMPCDDAKEKEEVNTRLVTELTLDDDIHDEVSRAGDNNTLCNKKKKCTKRNSQCINLPRSIKTLIHNLLIPSNNTYSDPSSSTSKKSQSQENSPNVDPFQTCREVHEDLVQMMTDPDLFFFDPTSNSKLNKLYFSRSRLYGRSDEMLILKEACCRLANRNVNNNTNTDTRKKEEGHARSMTTITNTTSTSISGFFEPGSNQNNNNSTSPILALSSDENIDLSTTTSATSNNNNKKHSELAFISGPSGAGKSELARRVCRPTIKRLNGSFVHGKFDQLHRGQPYSALIVAFTELCEDILSRNQTFINALSAKIRLAVGNLGRVVTDVIPILTKIIGPQPPLSTEIEGTELQNRFNFVMKMFVSALSTPDHPLVLVLDDLQWADSASMNLIQLLVKDVRNSSMLFVGCYRDNEIDDTHPLSVLLDDLRYDAMDATMTEISIGDLDKESVNHMISDSVRMSRRLTRPLSDIIHRKTNGNPFFVIEFLKSLYDETMLTYSYKRRRWVWNAPELEHRNISDNVVEFLIATKLQKLSRDTQDVLKIAAGIGSYFDSQMVRLVLKERYITKDCCTQELEWLLKEGLITKLRGRKKGTHYKFSNDRIQQAAYSLVLEEERDALHLQIGRLMLRRCESLVAFGGVAPGASFMSSSGIVGAGVGVGAGCANTNASLASNTSITNITNSSNTSVTSNLSIETGSDMLFFITADQLNRGAALIRDKDERMKLARLNLRAGIMAMQSSAFGPASGYLNAGIRMLGRNRWHRRQYKLTLMLYSNLAETEYCNGIFGMVELTVKEVFKHAKSVNDKFSAYLSLMMATAAYGDTYKAVDIGLEVLAQLGESFPTNKITSRTITFDLIKTKFALRGKSDKKLLSLPLMENQTKKMAMFVLSKLYSFSVQGPTHYIPLVINRMVRLTIRYGTCEASAFGFTLFGSVMCGVFGDVVRGLRYGQLGLELSSRFNSNKWTVRVLCIMVFTIWGWAIPYHEILEPCMRVYNMGMEVGDNEYAMYGLWNFSINSILGGKRLEPLADDMRSYARLISELGQTNVYIIFLPLLQCVLNLMGCSQNPALLTGEVMDQHQFLLECKNPMATCDAYILCLMLSYIFHDYEMAAVMFEKSKNASAAFPGCSLVWVRMFYGGLSSFAMATKTNGDYKKWVSNGRSMKNKIKKLVQICPETFLPKYKLLHAEHCAFKGKAPQSLKAYDEAIGAAHESGLISDEALAFERASIYLKSRGDDDAAERYYEHARSLYCEWGAHSKTD